MSVLKSQKHSCEPEKWRQRLLYAPTVTQKKTLLKQAADQWHYNTTDDRVVVLDE